MILAVSDEDKKITWKSYYVRLLNRQFEQNEGIFPVTYNISGVHPLIDKGMVRESISKMQDHEDCLE